VPATESVEIPAQQKRVEAARGCHEVLGFSSRPMWKSEDL
jgi:hypothetical protein